MGRVYRYNLVKYYNIFKQEQSMTTVKRYTTGQVAAILGISRGTAITRIDAGLIECYRDPVSGFRYILPEALEAYARQNNLPLFPLEKASQPRHKVLS